MSPGDPQPGPLGRFAAEVVGLDRAEGDAEGTTAVLFRKLRDHDFLPDPLAHEAILALAGRAPQAGSLLVEEVAQAEERRLLVEVERYAAGFFGLPVAPRAERHRRLGLACAGHPRLIERLEALRPGLGIDRSAVDDPSPLVRRLMADLLDLFPMPPGRRASEARERAERFRDDRGATDARRARALKELARRHPDLVALVPDHPARLTRPRRRVPAGRFRAGVARFLASSGPRPYWIIGAVMLSSAGRLFTTSTSTTPPFPSTAPTPGQFQLPKLDRKRMDSTLALMLRDEFKAMIRRELARIGKPIDGPQLELVVSMLPVEELPPIGGMASIRLAGQWTGPVRDRFIGRLKVALKSSGPPLNFEELDQVASRCFPGASPGDLP